MKNGKKILITGGSGFIGSHLARLLVLEDYDVTILDKVDPPLDLKVVEYIKQDINEIEKFSKVIDLNWFAIFHFAAIVSVQECEINPEESFKTNFLSIQTLLECNLNKKKLSDSPSRLFFASSAAVYGALGKPGKKLNEAEPLPAPLSFYGLHKYSAEQSIRLYSRNTGIPALSFRFFNVYGPGQKADSPYSGVISKFTLALHNGSPVSLFNEGKNERDFIHVLDIVTACAKALALPIDKLDGSVLNLSAGKSMSIKTVFELMSKVSGKITKINLEGPKIGDIEFSCGDPTCAEALLNWKARQFNGSVS